MSWLKRRLPKKRWKRVMLYLLSGFLILLAADMILAACWRRIDISPETTDITAPLDKDGLPDYTREFNARAAEGITAENNAAPELLRIIGTERFAEKMRARVFPPLGLPATTLPAQFVSYDEWRKAHPEIKAAAPGADESAEMLRAPWKGGEHPLWARWLDEQSGVLPPAFKALEKSRFYVPYASNGERPTMVTIMLADLSGVRRLSNWMTADAMRRLGEGDVAGFRKDVLATWKLSSLMGHRSSFLLEYLVAVAIGSQSSRSIEAAAVAPGLLSEEQAKELLHDVESAPPLPGIDRRILTGERWMLLDSTCVLSLRGPMGLGMDSDADRVSFGGKIGRVLIPIHYNEILRKANQHFDRVEEAMRRPTYHQRSTALQATAAELETRNARPIYRKISNPSGAITDLLLSLMMPALDKVNQVQEQERMERELARLALALRIYHVQRGEYPASLAPLASAILPAIPQDTFVEAPLKYRREGKGYLLYSVGPNEKDDGGTDRNTHAKDWDMVVRAAE